MSMFPNSQSIPVDYERDNARTKMLASFFNTVYAWMFAGLGITALVGWSISQSPTATKFIYGSPTGYTVLGLAAFVIAMSVQRVAMNGSGNLATALFLLYAVVIGALVSGIFAVYPKPTLAAAFLVTGGTFGAVSVVGFITKIDLTRMGGILIMAAIGLFLASIVNVFLANDFVSWIITYAVLAVFIGLTAYYTQQLKQWAEQSADNPAMAARLAIVGSLQLYVAFLNIFLSILRIMGGNGRR